MRFRFIQNVAAAILATTASLATASSTARNPLQLLGTVQNPSIDTQSHRVTALSNFDLSFDLYNRQHIRLRLEPNHDIIAEDATIQYLGKDGEIVKTETVDRLDHKVYKGSAWELHGGEWQRVGWARVMVRRDGVDPLFEGAFTIHRNHHHIQLRSHYMQTKHDEDPVLEDSGDEYMIVFRDSDIKSDPAHTELRKREDSGITCRADNLGFNNNPEHPVYQGILRRNEPFWGAMPIGSSFSKRQLDNPLGGGNSAGVNLVSTIGQTAGCPNARKVALVGVAADCTYISSFNSTDTARRNIIAQINTASDLYERTFNISLALKNLTVVDPVCPGTPQAATPWNEACSPNIDIQDRLNTFSAWRGTQSDSNAFWTLLTTCNTGSAVGLAWLGQACVNDAQSSNSTGTSETVSGANVVARTSTEWQVIAHETGHTFGAVHDCTSQSCADGRTVAAQQCCPLSASTCDAGQRFIMNPSTGQNIEDFSPCSIGNICAALQRNSVRSTCLTSNRDVNGLITDQQCGNGIVEEGEDCDCGGPEGCGDNPCCDATTCKFKTNAVCDDSNEDCCRNCQFASANTVCRASTGVCDPEEKCSGTSPTCPQDNTAPDGQSCGNDLQCASGQCTSRDLQCKTLMGSYTQNNDTYACDHSSCQLSCASPEFGIGVCYGMQQNFLDGTECRGGGRCDNGRCVGANFGDEVKSWIQDHKGIVIGISVGVGILVLLILLGCIRSCCARSKRKSRKVPSPPPGGWPVGAQQHRSGHHQRRSRSGPPPPMQQQQGQAPMWYGPPPPPYGAPPPPMQQGYGAPSPPMHQTYQPPQRSVRYA